MNGYVRCMCVLGENFRRAQLFALKIFLSADHPWSRKQLSIHSRQTAGEFQSSLLPKGRRDKIHSRPKAGELQKSLSPKGHRVPSFPVRIYREKGQNSLPPLPAGETPFALLELPGSPPLWVAPVSLRRKYFVGMSAPARSPLAPSACIQIFHPILSATRGGSFTAPRSLKVGQKFCFLLPPPVSPLFG